MTGGAPGPAAGRPSIRKPRPAKHDLNGVRFAVNVFLGATIVWTVLRLLADSNPIWALASLVAASDPQVDEANRMFRCRIANVSVGCAIGLVFLVVGGQSEWSLPIALAVAVLVSTYVVRIQTMWRQAPVTAAVVIAAGLTQDSQLAGIGKGLHRIAEVLFGCIVGLLVSRYMSRWWPIVLPDRPDETTPGSKSV